MPLTPVHLAITIGGYYFISLIFPIDFTLANCLLLASAELIDLDHLFAKPIYVKKRNSFKTHFLHKQWIIVSLIALFLIFTPLIFLGLGILLHFVADYLHMKYWLKID